MVPKRIVEALARHGFKADESVSGKIGGSWAATLDPIGRMAIEGDCRGIAVHDFTATAAEFWAECVREAAAHAGSLTPCPHAPGECEFHDEGD